MKDSCVVLPGHRSYGRGDGEVGEALLEVSGSSIHSSGGTCYEKLSWTCLHIYIDVSSSNFAEFRGGDLGNTNQNRVVYNGFKFLTGKPSVHSDAGPGLVLPTESAAAAAACIECS